MPKPKRQPGQVEIQWRVKSQNAALPASDLKWTYHALIAAEKADGELTLLAAWAPRMEFRIKPNGKVQP